MEVYLVGGAVRDELLGRAVSERDWVVVGGTAEAMLADGYRQVGKDFPVFLHPETGEEYALARTERKTGPGHKGFAVHADPSVTLEEDLARRDLTINAIARSQAGTLVDPYGGRADLEARLLRHVSVAFAEDPLRVFRVARFAAQLPEFEVAPETQMLIREMAAADALAELSAERVWAELVKALGGPAAGRFIDVLRTCDALKPWFEEFESVRSVLLDLPDDAQRFAGFVSNLAPEVLERLAVRLKTPRAHLRLALWIARHGKALARWQNEPADRIYAALTECRAFKPGNDLAWMLAVVEQLYGLDLTPLVDAVARIGLGNRPADLQAQGIQGAALGAALDQARIKALRVAQRAG